MDFYIALVFSLSFALIFMLYAIRIIIKPKPIFNRSSEGISNYSVLKFIIEAPSWFFSSLPGILIKFKITPNKATLLSLLFAILSGFFFSINYFGSACVFLFLSGAFDLIDGQIARMTNKCSNAGDLVDSIVDRYGEIFIFLGIYMHYHKNILYSLITILALIGSLMVSYVSVRGELVRTTFKWNVFRRPGRIILLCVGAITSALFINILEVRGVNIDPMIITLVILALGTNVEAIKNFFKIYHDLNRKMDTTF